MSTRQRYRRERAHRLMEQFLLEFSALAHARAPHPQAPRAGRRPKHAKSNETAEWDKNAHFIFSSSQLVAAVLVDHRSTMPLRASPAPPKYRLQTDFHQPCERRVDGSRVTEMIPGREWLTGRPAGQRGPDVNPLVPDPQNIFPPGLPYHLTRDHLHDRNREVSALSQFIRALPIRSSDAYVPSRVRADACAVPQNALFDHANPGLATYVRVTRRRHCNDPHAEAALHRKRMELREFEVERERMESKMANELLEARSQSVRKAMAQRSRLNMDLMQKAGKKPPEVSTICRAHPQRPQPLHSICTCARFSLCILWICGSGRVVCRSSCRPRPTRSPPQTCWRGGATSWSAA